MEERNHLMRGDQVVKVCRDLEAVVTRLNRLAGEVGMGRRSPFTSEELAEARAIARLGTRLGVVERVVVQGEAGAGEPVLLPAKLVEAYGLLWDAAYGSGGSQGLGDPNAGQARDGVGKGRQMRVTSSGQSVHRAGAVTKRDKSTRNVVKSREAFEFKRTVDRRLRKLTADVLLFLEGGRESVVSLARSCPTCGSLCAGDWRFCARCGGRVVTTTTTED